LKIDVWADHDIAVLRDAITGANEADKHYVGVNIGRDFQVPPERFADLRNAGQSDPCPKCGTPLALRHAIEVGHVFKLGTKYSSALDAKFLDAQEQQHTIIMACYGIGVNRIIAGLCETSHDADGIIWPLALAPYEVILTPINVREADVMQATNELYDALTQAGADVLLDDRDQRPGVKFKDADLIGIPLRIVIGGRTLKDAQLEIKWRWEPQAQMIPLADAAQTIVGLLAAERANPHRAAVPPAATTPAAAAK
jgi:prolyl-tRNA synthetase